MGEQARLILAIVLCMLVFLAWSFLTPKTAQKPVQVSRQQAQEQKPIEQPYDKPVEPSEPGEPGEPGEPLPQTKTTGRIPGIITIDSPLYTVRISEKGAVVTSVILKDFRETAEKNSVKKELIAESVRTVRTSFSGISGFEDAFYSVDFEYGSKLDISSPKEIVFWTDKEGIRFEKRFLFSPDTYMIGLNIAVKNGSERVIQDSISVEISNRKPNLKTTYGFEGLSALIGNQLEQIKIDDVRKNKENNSYSGEVKWAAIETRYFMTALIPRKSLHTGIRLSLDDNADTVTNRYIIPFGEIAPLTSRVFESDLYFGPKSFSLLSKLNNNLSKAINFGWFDFIAKPCLWLMNFFYSVIPNYGIAIIILTLLTKVLLWPLGNKAYKSMNEMKKLQPLMMEIRERYKEDKRKMNEELMNLYKIYKVNPMGGCLPMIVQIPVFFALYRMLYEAIELRHAPFVFWINDLSAPDRLFRFNFAIPMMEPPYGIPVLTIIMGATMFIQQKMSPPPGDPAQAKVMMLMPIIFTFIFINFSSGLVLYWLVNNILSIAQQYYISKKA